jgi:putative ABC transport system permease protein
LRNVPGIRSVGMVNFLPFAGPSAGTGFHISGKPKPAPDQEPITNVFVVDDGYFRTLQIPLKRGRLFSQDEMAQRKHVVVVNEALVQKYFPNEDPLGKRITIFMRDDDNVPSQIIGIVGNVKHGSIDEQAFASVYWPHPELAYSFMNLVIRTEKDPQNFAPSAIAIVRDLDREIPVADIRTLEDWVDDSTASARFHTVLLILLASIALILALAGVYGVISYSVAQRTQEMGIRMALGANRGNIFRLVLKHGSLLIVFGIVIGSAIAFAVTRLMRAMLYETSTTDPMIFLAAIVFLVMTALLACSIPSLRASKVDPLVALRYE